MRRTTANVVSVVVGAGPTYPTHTPSTPSIFEVGTPLSDLQDSLDWALQLAQELHCWTLAIRLVQNQLSVPTCLPEACFSPRLVCVAVLGLIALCIGRLVHALAALSVPVDVTHL